MDQVFDKFKIFKIVVKNPKREDDPYSVAMTNQWTRIIFSSPAPRSQIIGGKKNLKSNFISFKPKL